MRNPIRPQPAPPAFGQGEVVPETRASPLARLLFSWLDPFLSVGFSRPLEKEDFWSLPDSCLTHSLTERVEEAFWIRCPPESRPGVFSQDGGKPPNARATEPVKKEATRSSSKETKTRGAEEKEHAETTVGVNPDEPPTGLSDEKRKGDEPKYDSSLLKALHTVFWAQFWLAGSLKFVADTLTTTTPLVNQVLLSWLTKSYVYFRASDGERATLGLQKPPGIGYGIGLAFTIFVMQQVSSLATNHYSMMAMSNGLWLRTSLVGAIFRKSLRLSGRARLEHNVGQITTMISADTVRLEQNAFLVHNLWIAPLQIALGIGLLIRNLGVAALVGLAILLLGGPIEFILAQVMFKQRLKGVTLTDQRVHMTSEVLSGIRLIKYFAWESFYAHQVSNLRDREVRTIRRLAAARALLIGVVMVIPTVATVLSIITYALKKHSLDIAIIFSSVQYFSIIRVPLILLPVVLASATDALVAIRRIGAFMRSEELLTLYEIDVGADSAIDVDADFTWEAVRKDENAINLAATFGDDKKAKHMAVAKKGRKTGDGDASLLPTAATTLAGASPARSEENAAAGGGSGKVKEEDKPFALDGVKLISKIPPGLTELR